MENTTTTETNKLSFHGSGGEYFGVMIVNWLLTALTFGLYYPWAKARQLSFIYGSIALNEDRFAFHGTGKEMFKGFIKAILLFLAVGIVAGLIGYFVNEPAITALFFYAALFAIMPIAIHGSYRYRMSRTSWRGIRFGYRGNRTELIKLFFKGIFLTIITLFIYGSWFAINLRTYLLSNIRFGNLSFKYNGKGSDYFVMNLVGYLLTIVTLGIYGFWWQRNIIAYFVDNLSLHDNDKQIAFKFKGTGGSLFGLTIVNMLIIIFTLGIGYAWVVMRTINYITSNIELTGDINLNAISQTEANFTDATFEDVGDFLDIDFVM